MIYDNNMAENGQTKTVSFKDLIEKKDVSVTGFGIYFIGLSTSGDVAIETNDENLCMVLLTLTLQENGGCTLSPANSDLVCYINSNDPLSGEMHLIDGTKLEIADKKLMFIDGPIPRRRRKLPPTPGLAVGDPPAKPSRNKKSVTSTGSGEKNATADESSKPETHNNAEDDTEEKDNADKRWLETSWCMLDLRDSEQDLFRNLETPEQIGILSASYFSKQLRMFTDATITQKLLDDVFRLFMDTVEDCREIYMNYLSDLSKALAKVPDKSNTRPMHGPAVRFLTELLKQCIDPVERVILILDLLRTFSHFDNNLTTMIHYQTTSAVLGSMSAYLDVVEVQQYGVDILAKIATYKPTLDKKAPLREVGLDLVIRSVKYHEMNVNLSRSACRVFANIASTFINVLSHWLDTEHSSDTDITRVIEQCENLVEYVFREGIPTIQAIMKTFGNDLGVNTEGRKFIFYYAKLPQLQLKKSQWLKQKDAKPDTLDNETNESIHGDEDNFHESVTSSQTISKNEFLSGKIEEEEPQGILKHVGSYDNHRTSEKRLVFADDTVGGSDTETTYSSVSEDELEHSVTRNVTAEVAEDFSNQIVHHLVRKTIKRRKSCDADGGDDDDQADISDSDSENEFLQSLSVTNTNENKEENMYVQNESETSVTRNSALLETNINDKAVVNNDMTVDKDINIHSEVSEETEENSRVENNTKVDVDADLGKSAVIDVTFLGKLVRTQIIVHVGSLVFRGEDSMVLMVIDKPIAKLLEETGAPPGLIEFAEKQYGGEMTLMDLEPAIVISVIDAVRYRSVTKDLVQSAVLSLTRTVNEKLQAATLNITMLFYKALFADEHLRPIVTDEEYLKEFRPCFHNATERMEKSHNVEEVRKNLGAHCVLDN